MTTAPAPNPDFTIWIDGDCPLCAKEAGLMRRMDRGRGRLAIVDIAAPDFDPAAFGLTRDRVMAEIHGQNPSGEVITGMEVFRRAYRAVGWGWLLGWTAWPIVRPIADAAYRFFARHRLTITGRRACADGVCAIPDQVA